MRKSEFASDECPLISIVLPTRNRASYLAGCIDSCLNQTYSNLELVIVNDGSTDDTATILSEYEKKDKRIRVFHEFCGSLPAVLNYGFRWTWGDYLTWMCDDDFYEPDTTWILKKK